MLIAILTAILKSCLAWSLTGTQVAQKVYDSNREPFSVIKYKMTLTTKSGSQVVREFATFNFDNHRYDAKTLIVFSKPKKFSETAMLTHNKKIESGDQWLYLPALKKVRRISTSNKSGRFVGSDLTYEDLEIRDVNVDKHKLIKRESRGKKNIYVLQSIADKKKSQYSKAVYWIDSRNWTVLQALFYKNNKSKPHKKLENKNFKRFGKTWVPMTTTIENYDIKHKTKLEVMDVNFKVELPDRVFKRQSLENQKPLSKFLK